ncbi:filamentous hemagglutinin N-terminal domain-containing protein [Selenomonas ruminis]|uniref:Filamentous hemagglutinin N-terminal domain-containing protein n=1 Tax=Selenomonas ruminis TaxID=2593411 RepID=A0A5D6W2B7_9FIRM|nr:filamentous hemagglutinin N-terminal domain-containing protein [Selenomonas sp. mPRGC5]TYZ22591.1 filamentous hemagglutinin N-terminal domain-containing protein [Selenomonas sp. mPRGC5]
MKKTTFSKKILRFAVASGLMFSLSAPLVQAMPQGGEVLNGGVWVNGSNRWLDNSSGKFDAVSGDEFQAQKVYDPNDKALVIKWDSFDIASGEKLVLNGQGVPFINIVNSGKMSTIAGTLETTGLNQVYVVNTSGINVTDTANVTATNLTLSTVEASDAEWKSLSFADSAKAKGDIKIATPNSIDVYGNFTTNSVNLEVADGVSFKINTEDSNTSWWDDTNKVNVSSEKNWDRSTVTFNAENNITFSGYFDTAWIDQKGDVAGHGAKGPIEATFTGKNVTFNVPTKTTEYTVGMNFNLYNDANTITVNGTESIAINGGKFAAGSGSINLNSPKITAASGTVFDATTKKSSSKIEAAEGVNVDDFTVTGTDLPSDTPADTPSSEPSDTPSDTPADTPSSDPSDTPVTPGDEPAKKPLSNNETVNKVLDTLSVAQETKEQMVATIEEENDMVVADVDQEAAPAESVEAEDNNVRVQANAMENLSNAPAAGAGLEVADNVSFTA